MRIDPDLKEALILTLLALALGAAIAGIRSIFG
jgi:hypothetical protein